MKCLQCHLVNFNTAVTCKRCQSPLLKDAVIAADNQTKVYNDSGFLVAENITALPKRCYKCNSRKVVGTKAQTLEHTPALEELLDIAVGQLIPIPLPLSLTPNKKVIQLDLYFCPRHRSAHRILFKIGWGMLFFSILCFAAGLYLIDYYAVYAVSAIISVTAFCIGLIILYIEREREILSRHKYQAPYFWIKGFGKEYLSSFPEWINSPPV